jgi:hypothetical protein
MYKKCASWKTSFLAWRFIMWYGSIMLARSPAGVFVQVLKQPSIKSSPQVTTDVGPQQPDREVMMLGEDWREAYIDFIRDQRLPAGMDARSAEAARVMRRNMGFVLVNSKLCRHGA